MSVMRDDAGDLPAAAAGDAEAFARLYDRHAPVVLSLCRRQMWSREEAEDALQDIFLRAYPKLHEVTAPAKLRPWLYGITKRVCKERRRAARRRLRHELAAPGKRMDDRRRTESPIEAAVQTEQLERLTAAIDALPDDQRLAIHLYYLEEDPVEAARKAMKLSRQGFYRRLARARDRLAILMREGTPA